MAELLGLLLGTDDGIVQVLPGEAPRPTLRGVPIAHIDVANGQAIAASPGHGVWRHRGRGDWEQVWEGDARVARISPDGPWYIGAHPTALYVSTDAGTTWSEIATVRNVLRHYRGIGNRPGTRDGGAMAGIIFPSNGGVLVGIAGIGTWASRDGGTTWMPRADGLDPELHGLWEHPERRERLYAATRSGFYRSEDGGFSWVQSLNGIDRSYIGSVCVLPGTPDVALLSAARRAPGAPNPDDPADTGAANCAVFRSVNGGVAWRRFGLEPQHEWRDMPLLARLDGSYDIAFAVAGGQAWASHDRGEHWLPLADGLPQARALAVVL